MPTEKKPKMEGGIGLNGSGGLLLDVPDEGAKAAKKVTENTRSEAENTRSRERDKS